MTESQSAMIGKMAAVNYRPSGEQTGAMRAGGFFW